MKLVRLSIVLAFLALSTANIQAQDNALPMIGAQAFIEPGQSAGDIDHLFDVMESNGMKVGRIRMFGSHMQLPDGGWDFSLYDQAFSAAERHGVKLFATLFPFTDELSDVGGFKFPRSFEHLEQVDNYVKAVVEHFKDSPALYCWVLQNEPGTGGSVSPRSSEVARKVFEEYIAVNPIPARDGYLGDNFTNEKFTRYYTAWYLRHISDLVSEIDPAHGRHINPHQFLQTYPEYDFNEFESFLTSLGASMHFSWHFSEFQRHEYPLGVALMSDLVSQASGDNPWWITEMQGGMVTASGYNVLCPTPEEIEQSVWTGIMSGAKGVIFWTLNQRKAVQESGEWGLLDYTGGNSPRIDAINGITQRLQRDSAFFAAASPLKDRIAVLLNIQSQWIQTKNSGISKDNVEGRSRTAVIKSVIAAYKSLCECGLSPRVEDMDLCNWDDFEAAILPDCIALTEDQIEALKQFVAKGGRLIVTGLTGYYSQTMGCRFMEDSPLYEMLGGRLKEVEVQGDPGTVEYKRLRLPNHIWSGLVCRNDGTTGRYIENAYGEGSVLWLPSMIDIGCRKHDPEKLTEFYRTVLGDAVSGAPLHFASPKEDVYMRVMRNGESYKLLVVNKSAKTKAIRVKGIVRKRIVLKADSYTIIEKPVL